MKKTIFLCLLPTLVYAQAPMKRLTHESIKTIGPYSPAAWAGNMLYLSGQIGVDPKTGVFAGATTVEQARQTMTNIGQILQIAGLSYSNIVKTTIFLTDMADFAAVNDVYASFFPPGDYPARETVAVVALPRGAKIEISVVAYKPD